MSHSPNPNPPDDALNRLIDVHLGAAREELTPSSGFAASVMESIRAQATEPPPIAFPWRRVFPGVIAILGGLVALIVFVIRTAKAAPLVVPSPHSGLLAHLLRIQAFTPGEATAAWILLAVCLSIAAIVVSLRLTRHSQ